MPFRVPSHRPRSPFSPAATACLWACILFSLSAGTAFAQNAATTGASPAKAAAPTKPVGKAAEPGVAPAGPCIIELDLQALLLMPDVVDQAIVDPVWDVRPPGGHRLMQLPFKINFPADRKEPFELNASTVKIRGSVALCWHIIDEKAARGKGAEGEVVIGDSLPKNIPTIARKVTLDPEGKVKWKMERTFQGANLKPASTASENDIYILKLDQKQLNGRNPGAPPIGRRQGGEDERSWLDRINRENTEHKVKLANFNELSKRLRELPSEFEWNTPTRIWLVVDLNPTVADIDITIDQTLENVVGPWKVLANHLTMLRKNTVPFQVVSEGDKYILPREANDLIAAMSAMMANPHVNNYRMVATQISVTGLAKYAIPGDPLYKLLESLIKTGDRFVISTMSKELATVFPPTKASTSLLLIVTPHLNPKEKILVLQDKFKNKSDLRAFRDTLLDVNGAMNDNTAAPPDELIDKLMEASDTPDIENLVAGTLQFDGMSPERLNKAITKIIQNAPTNTLCARLLDQKLLGSSVPLTQLRTLEMLAAADSADKHLGDVFNDYILDLAFGAPRDSVAVKNRIKMTDHILIESPNHSLFRLLGSTDTKIHDLTWHSLVHFAVADIPDLNPDLYRIIVDAAIAQQPIPPQIIEFLIHQPNTSRIVESLFRIILLGKDAPISVMACKAIKNSKDAWPVDKAMSRLSYGDRHGLAIRIYEYLTGEKAPLVVGLLRQRADNLPLAAWFGSELANDRLPKPEAWGAQISDEDRLLELAIATDKDLALAACSALLLAAGGEDKLSATLLTRLQNIEEPNPEKTREEWKTARQEIYNARVQKIAGPIRIRVEVLDKGVANGSPINAPSSKQPSGNPNLYDLGTTDFISTNEGIKLANNAITMTIATTQLGVRVEKPSEIKVINADLLAKIPFDKIVNPALLAPKPDGSWRGLMLLPDGKTVELSFIPTTP